ncbi:hypothetical protein AAFF_G00079480 [Aldrovandia affinis]|uniref:Max-binding protein MNT n=1 Tax=Aldrovandia affinis TaxID=143900 RepID=A0AAD7WCM3_9TELE|nr:hypothetical protein AAFF_G00079480 [Aldrovandia affinis]
MSIETLLEAAKFLEWQALQQQKAREEDELKEKLRLNQEAEQTRAEVVRINHHQLLQLASQVKAEPTSPPQTGNPASLASQYAPLPHALQAPPSPALQSAVTDDLRNLDAKKRPGGAGTREVHNKLEKNRRAHLKECFETLKKTVPTVDEKKTSNLSVLRSALRYIQTLKRKEKEYEHEMERLAREKIATQQRLAELKNELSQWMNVMEMERVLRLTAQPEDDQASTSTASEGEDNMDEDTEEDRLQPLPKVVKAAPPSLPAQLQPPKPLAQTLSGPPAHAHIVTAPSMPSVIAHASVIQAGSKHLAHLSPAPSSSPQPIGHITVHPVAHLYPPPAMMSHLAHTLSHAQVNTLSHAQVNTLSHAQVNNAVSSQPAVVTHHPQLVGQTILNPVTMVTMPSFPVSTLKLA